MQALIDGDIVAYRCAFSANNDPEEAAILRVENLMRQILNNVCAETYRVFISGEDNFRYKIWPEYKANRKDTPKPVWLQQCREYLLKEWNAEPMAVKQTICLDVVKEKIQSSARLTKTSCKSQDNITTSSKTNILPYPNTMDYAISTSKPSSEIDQIMLSGSMELDQSKQNVLSQVVQLKNNCMKYVKIFMGMLIDLTPIWLSFGFGVVMGMYMTQ